MQITLNGEAKMVTAATIAQLLAEIKAPPRGIAVERNRAIIPKSEHATTSVQPGDHIEIVTFIGGG